MAVTIGLMGFGRIGRNLFRILHRSDEIRIGAISDIAEHSALTYLLRYDSILGRFPSQVTHREGRLYTWGREIPFLSGRNPGDVNWADFGVDYVIEASGRDHARATLQKHIDVGARRVILCAPPSDEPDISVIYGVNHDRVTREHKILSNASCTAHCAAPVLNTLHEAFGIDRAHITAVHAYTNVQRLADVPGDDMRMSRAAAENIVPSETNCAHVLDQVLPDLRGRVRASALRVPVPNGSIVDFTIWAKRPLTKEGINEVMRTAASGPYREILEYQEDPIVSSDVANTEYSSVFDSLATMTLDSNLVKCIAWFDNSWGYSHRVVDLLRLVAKQDGLLGEEAA